MRCKLVISPLWFLLIAILPGCHRERESHAVIDDTSVKLAAGEIDIGDPVYEPLLLRGFYESEGGWRWTARRFAISLTAPPGKELGLLALDFNLPIEMRPVFPVTMTARVNGVEVGRRRYTRIGRYQFTAVVPNGILEKHPAEVEFELDKSVRLADRNRELGVIAMSASLSHTSDAGFDRNAEILRARQGYQYLLAKRDLLVPPGKQQELMKLFHEVPVWRHMFFQNVQIEKSPLDLWMMQQIIYETQPDFIVETGTWRGGSALYWAYTLKGMGLEDSRVLTVDVQDIAKVAAAHPLWKKYVTSYQGSSTDPDIVSKIAGLVKGRKTLVTLDSDHTMPHVLKELKAYVPLVSRGSYLVVEDTHMDAVPTAPEFGPGPMAAVRRFLEDGGSRDFQQDLGREAYIMTFNPGGWLRRK